MFDNGLKERLHGAAGVAQIRFGIAFLGAGENDRKIHLFIGSVQRNEEIPDQVQHFGRNGIVAVDLVDAHDGLGEVGVGERDERCPGRGGRLKTTADGLGLSLVAAQLQHVDPDAWRHEVIGHEELFIALHDHLPPEMVYERELLICRM